MFITTFFALITDGHHSDSMIFGAQILRDIKVNMRKQ